VPPLPCTAVPGHDPSLASAGTTAPRPTAIARATESLQARPGGATWPASRCRRPVDPDLDDLPARVARDVLDHGEGGEVRADASQPALARAPAAVLLAGLGGHATGPYLAEDPVRAKRTAGPPPALDAGARAVRAALRRRGLCWEGEHDPTPLLVPDGAARDRHYDLLGHYSYRLFLRDVLKQRDDLRPERLGCYVGPPVAARYLRFLLAAGLVRRAGRGVYRVCDDRIVSFGGTLEWYVAQVLAREYGCASAH